MKKILLLSVSLFFALASCKKKAEVIPVNTISATVDGVTRNFNVNVSAQTSTNPMTGYKSLYIQGLTSTTIPGGSMVVSLTSTSLNSIAKGTYTVASVNNNPPVWVQVMYDYDDHGSNTPNQPYVTDSHGTNPTTVNITSISSTNVQGTFSGTLVYSQGGSDTKTVTSGKFNVNITNP